MRLQLTRPLAFFDLEATGVNKDTDRIVEIAICKINPDGTREIKTHRINPGIPIPAPATEIHGISDEDVKNEPSFSKIAKSLFDFLVGCDIAGYNSNAYDIPLLFNEFQRVGIYWDYTKFRMIDAGNIFKIQEPRTLTAAYKFYCDKDLDNAHSAEADILATVDVFLAQMDKYEDLPADLDELHLYCNYGKPILDLSGKFSIDSEGDIIFNFGPNRGLKAKQHLDFVNWMYNRDFPQDTLEICRKIIHETGFLD